MRTLLLASALWASFLIPAVAGEEEGRAVPFADQALGNYEAALATSLDVFRAGGRDRVIQEVETCYGHLPPRQVRPERIQYCYPLGDAATETLRASGDGAPVPPLMHEPARRERTLTLLAQQGLMRPASDLLLSTWGAIGRHALTLHEDDLKGLKGPASTEPTKDAR